MITEKTGICLVLNLNGVYNILSYNAFEFCRTASGEN